MSRRVTDARAPVGEAACGRFCRDGWGLRVRGSRKMEVWMGGAQPRPARRRRSDVGEEAAEEPPQRQSSGGKKGGDTPPDAPLPRATASADEEEREIEDEAEGPRQAEQHHPGRLAAGGAEIEEVLRRLRDLPGEPDRRAQQRDSQDSRDDERQGFEPAFLRLRTAGVFDEFLRHRTPAYGPIPTGRWMQRPQATPHIRFRVPDARHKLAPHCD